MQQSILAPFEEKGKRVGPRLPSGRHVVELMTRDPMSPSRREADAKGHSRYYYYIGIDCSLAGDNLQFAIKDAFWIIFKFLSTDRYFVGFHWNVFDLIYSVSCESGKMNFKSNVLYFLKRCNKKYILKLLKLLFSNIYYSRPLLIYLLRVTSVTFPRSITRLVCFAFEIVLSET